jgi:hypothetical protein
MVLCASISQAQGGRDNNADIPTSIPGKHSVNYVIIGTGDHLNLNTQQAVSFFAHHYLQDRVA